VLLLAQLSMLVAYAPPMRVEQDVAQTQQVRVVESSVLE